jgi:hypothetical protein
VTALLACALLALGLAIFGYPLLRRTGPRGQGRGTGQLVDLEERYRNALADLQDAEMDWQIGNLSPADYALARDRHRHAAAEALQAITVLTETRERVRAELAREIASATGSHLVEQTLVRPATNGRRHDAAEVIALAQAAPARRAIVPTPLVIGLAMTVVAIAGIVGLYLRIHDVQTNQTPLSTLPIAHAHVIALDEDGRIQVGHHGGLLQSQDGRTWQALDVTGEIMALVRGPDGRSELALGHDTLLVRDARDGPWRPLEHDLPGTDVHGASVGMQGIYAYVEQRGLFLSRDGRGWEQTGPPLRESVGGLAVLPRPDADDVFVVANRTLLRTRDGGRTWSSAAGAASMALGGAVQAVAADRAGGLLYAGTTDGVFRSETSGSSWTRLPFHGSVSTLAARGTQIALVDGERRFFLSRDGGGSWGAP